MGVRSKVTQGGVDLLPSTHNNPTPSLLQPHNTITLRLLEHVKYHGDIGLRTVSMGPHVSYDHAVIQIRKSTCNTRTTMAASISGRYVTLIKVVWDSPSHLTRQSYDQLLIPPPPPPPIRITSHSTAAAAAPPPPPPPPLGHSESAPSA